MTTMTAPRLQLPASSRRQIADWAAAGYPHETCGLLLGRSNGGCNDISEAIQVDNLNTRRAHDRFELDPGGFQAADARAREQGLDIIGVWHSHPDHPAEPSETDRSQAWPEWSYIIVRVTATGARELRSWRLDGPAFTEELIEETEDKGASA